MKRKKARQIIEKLLESMDIRIDEDRPWDIRVSNPEFYPRVLSGGSLALGESYMDGWWDCHALDQFFEKIFNHHIDRKVKAKDLFMLWGLFAARLTNLQSRARAFIIGRRHYDTGNRLFSIMLDRGMNYSCACWHNVETLDEAQELKLDMICRKLDLRPGMTVLDIGCGWGGFAKFAAQKYGARVYGITVSKEQVTFARKICREFDVTIDLKDYRTLNKSFDRVVSIGMFEHVGWKNYRTFMKVVKKCLKPEGVFLLHTIAGNTSVKSTDPWIQRYIFPNSMLPSARQISQAAEGLLLLEDWHSFGPYYDRTLMAWHENFNHGWNQIKDRYDHTFYRMWCYYLLSCAASFRSRQNQVWQIVFSKGKTNRIFHPKEPIPAA